MKRSHLIISCVRFAAGAALLASPVAAAPPAPTNIQVFHRTGQSFVTWDEAPDSTVTYRVYRSAAPITDVSALTPLGEVDQNTTLNARALAAEGASYPYRIVPGIDLLLTTGLFVHTTAATGAFYYAVTSVSSASENMEVSPGQNATTVALPETLALPLPVLQRTITPGNGRSYDIYVHWTSNIGTALHPKMCVVPSKPFTFMIMRKGTAATHPLLVGFHAGDGNYWGSSPGSPIVGTGWPEEWVLNLDDALENGLSNGFWYGYHDGMTWKTVPPVPTSGTNVDYTERRVVYAFDWTMANLPIDPNRVCCNGWSMGGSGAAFVGYALRDRVASVVAYVPKLDLSYLSEVNPLAAYNPGAPQRLSCNYRWGAVFTNLPSSDGILTYDRLNFAFLVASTPNEVLPQCTFFAGRNDYTVGWGEKLGPVFAMLAAKQPFVFLWDSRTHNNTTIPGEWSPMLYWPSWVYDYRLYESLPAFSNCSADGNLGNGNPATADSFGTINGHLRWDSPPGDEVDSWSVVVRNRDLTYTLGSGNLTKFAPDTIFVDVTPRRLQTFQVAPGSVHLWQVEDATTSSLLASGTAVTDFNGLLTVPDVLVTDNGARVTILEEGSAVPGERPDARASLRPFPNPSTGLPTILLTLPRDARFGIDVVDIAGRRLAASPILSLPRGTHVVTPENAGLSGLQAIAPGVYFYRVTGPDADALGAVRSGRWVLLR